MNSAALPPKTLMIFAGPNGSGKSTIADLIAAKRDLGIYINADSIAHALSVSGTNSEIQAGKLMLLTVNELIKDNQSLSFETTLSGKNWVKLIQEAKEKNYRIILTYVAVNSPDISYDRVKKRVLEGGHNIPLETIKRRYPRSLNNFLTIYKKLVDDWYFFDNSKNTIKLVAQHEETTTIFDTELYNYYLDLYGK